MSARELITDHLDLWTGAVTKKSSSGRGSNGKVELTGVKKLRELILELAVRGKLVDQSQEDEPSSELLKKIVAEKDKRIERGEIKKPKKLPAINDAELPFQIPATWQFIRLGDAVDIIRGITFPASEKSKSPAAGRLACLRTTNVQDTIEIHDLLYIKESFVTKNSQYIQKHDIVMSMANSRELVGKVAFVEEQPDEPMTFGGFLGVLRPTLIHPKFLMAVLRSPHSRKTLIGNASQTTNIANISIGKLNPLVIGLPPLEEQHRIVQKVDELMALCDRLEQQTSDQLEAHENLVDTLLGTLTQPENATELADNWARLAAHFDTLFTTEQSIDKLKQTILQLATAGKLVPFQGAPVPLKNFLSFGPRNGFSPKESNYETGCKVLKLGATTKGWLDLLESKNVDIGNSVPPHLWLKKGDILIQRGNAANHVGCSVLLDSDYPNYIYPDLMMKVRVKEEVAIPSFVALYLAAPGARQFMWERMTGTSGTMPKISKKVVEEIPVSLPDIETQKAVVQKVDELITVCDQLKERLNQASETRCQLAEAVVENALN